MTTQEEPEITYELIKWMERTYPDRVPLIDTSEREVWASVGEQRVITRLRQMYDQENNPSED